MILGTVNARVSRGYRKVLQIGEDWSSNQLIDYSFGAHFDNRVPNNQTNFDTIVKDVM